MNRLALLLLFGSLPCADVDVSTHVAALLEGVETVERPGAPGALAVYGDQAFVVLTGGKPTAPVPVVAAAVHGKGRVAAFTHNGYLANGVLGRKDGGAARLVANTVRWLGGGKTSVRIGLLGTNPELLAAMKARGHAVTPNASPTNVKSLDVLVAAGGLGDDPQQHTAVRDFVAKGGGFLAALCPWGYEQVQAKRGLTLRNDLAENHVLRPMGLVFAQGIADGNRDGAYAVDLSRPADAHAGHALAAIEGGKKVGARDVNTVVSALRSLPRDDTTFLPRVRKVIGALSAEDAPRPDRGLGSGRPRARLAVAWESDTWRELPPSEVRAAPGADAFPGAVGGATTVAPVKDHPVAFDASVRGLQGCGLYLPAGTVLRLDVAGDPDGWRVQIGCHTDKLWHKDVWKRWPEITHRVDLVKGTNELATPFGGTLFVEATRADAAPLHAKVSGAVAAPRFVLGDAASARAWTTSRQAPGPWAELEGRNMVLSVPSSVIRDLEDPGPVLAFWDSVLASHVKLAGTPLPDRRERFVPDAQISAGYMHSGYPIMCQLDVVTPPKGGGPVVMLDLATLTSKGNWGFFHELGHNRQKPAWTFEGTTEVTCNLFSLHAGEELCGIEPWENPWLVNQRLRARAYLKTGAKFADWQRQPGTALVMYAQVQKAFGWEPFRRVLADYERIPKTDLPKTTQARIDTWMRRLSLAVSRDLRPFFTKWGLPLGETARSDKLLDELATWMPDFEELE